MTRTALTIAALALLPGVATTAEPPPLDDEFLEYLSEFEGQKDDWTWFAGNDEDGDGDDKPQPAPPPQGVKKVER